MIEKKIFSIDVGEHWNASAQVLALAGKTYSVQQWRQPIINLSALLSPKDGHIDGTVIIDKMFSKRRPDVFISHSHQDVKIAIAFADFLKDRFGVEAFVDSLYWGDSEELLRAIDDVYCVKENSPGLYSYEARNSTTSHVHVMLAASLAKVMRESNVILFLKTKNSVDYNLGDLRQDDSTDLTHSPWIFLEWTLAKLLYRRERSLMQESFSGTKDSAPIVYNIYDDFPELTIDQIEDYIHRSEKHTDWKQFCEELQS